MSRSFERRDNIRNRRYNKYRAHAEEGKGTYEGMRKSENAGMALMRILMLVIVVFVIGFIGVSVQGSINHCQTGTQWHRDVSPILNESLSGHFSTSDMNHN